MYNGHTIGAVVPWTTGRQLLDSLPTVLDRAYVVIAEDSADLTTVRRHVAALNADHEGVFSDLAVPIRLESCRGVGDAVSAGYRRAHDEEIDLSVVLGGSVEPSDLERWISAVVDDVADFKPLVAFDPEPNHV
ncbi:MAG: hypothetical protein ABEI98_11920 [Halorhabdus sp.]